MITIRGKEINVNVTHVMAYGAGVVTGTLVGFLVARKAAETRANWRIASEVESVKAHYRARANARGKGDNPHERATATVGDPGTEPATAEEAELRSYGPDRTGMGSILNVSDVPGEAPDGDDGGPDLLEGMPGHDGDPGTEDDNKGGEDGTRPVLTPPRDRRTKPHVISHDQFHVDEEPPYRKLTITYYEGDQVLVDDREVPIRNSADIGGKDFSSRFGQDSDDPNIVYIRNHRLETDFEIVKDERSYVEVILNYGNPK